MTRVASRRARAAAAVALLALAACGGESASETPVRGLVLITVDTLRRDHLGVLGGPVPTPSFDRLAAEGVLVEQAVTPTPTTGPAHASLFTGLHPWHHGVLDNAVPIGAQSMLLAERLRERGFATAAFVSSFVLHPRFGFDRGFDTYVFAPTESFTYEGRLKADFYARGEETTRAAMTWLTRHVGAGDQPFFLWVHYFDPHAPYQPPERYAVDGDSPVDLSHKTLPEGARDMDDLARQIRAYRGEVRYADAQVGQLLDRLLFLDILDETAVIFVSDHGEGLGDHGLLKHGANLYDELVRIPLIVRAPGIRPGRRLAGAAQLEDLLPTALSLVGAPIPDDIDGVDLLPWLRGEVSGSPRRVTLGRRRHYKGLPVLYFQRRFPEKWIGTIDGDGQRFDLLADGPELAGQRGPGASPELRRAVAHESEAQRAPQLDGEMKRALEALGYADSSPE